MSDIGSVICLYAETPLHAGSGTGAGAVDLPIQRERMSGLPMVQGSGIKGGLREELREALRLTGKEEKKIKDFLDEIKKISTGRNEDDQRSGKKGQEEFSRMFEERWQEYLKQDSGEGDDRRPIEVLRAWLFIESLFGPDIREDSDGESDMFTGSATFLDARLLLMPIRTLKSGWAWATCPLILERLGRDLERLGETCPAWAGIEVRPGTALVKDSRWLADRRLVLEDFAFPADNESYRDELKTLCEWLQAALPDTSSYANFRNRLANQLLVLSDEDFEFFCRHFTEVTTRVRMDEKTGTVARGALWAEEALPAESLLWTVALFSRERRAWSAEIDGLLRAKLELGRPDASSMRSAFMRLVEEMSRIRLGGDRTTGRGLVGFRTRLPTRASTERTGEPLPDQRKDQEPARRDGAMAGGAAESRVIDIDRQRAQWAWKAVERVEKEAKQVRDTYGGLTRKLPTLIQSAGLGQTLAFLHAHGRTGDTEQIASDEERQESVGRAGGYSRLLEDLLGRLKETGLTGPKSGLDLVMKMDQEQYRLATREVSAAASWLKRIAEGRLEAGEV